MTGKIFQESNNIYQDQAKILFNYYSQAAENIVREEERIEKEVRILEEEKAARNKDISGLWVWFLTIILFFVYFIKKSGLQKQIQELDMRIADFKKQHADIFRDYKVSKLGVAYVPVADQIKYEDKSFIVDYTGKVGESEVTLQLSRQNDLLIETIANLENLSAQAPIVETSKETEELATDEYSTSIQQINQHDYFGKLERSLRTISYCMDDLDTTSVSLPLVADRSEYLQYLNEYATSEIPENAPVIPVFDKEKYAGSVNKFQELNKLKDSLSNKTAQFEDVLKGLMMTMANSVQAISALKVASADKVIFESNKVLYQILKSPYNHYSPILEHEEIERIRNEKFDYSESVQGYEPFQLKQSSRVRYNLLSGMWTAEDGSTTNMPFGVHQIYEEIVAPVVQNLMQENRIERLKIYNHIKDQKIEYLNRWHENCDDFYGRNRAEAADIIRDMEKSLQEYVAAYNTLIALQRTEDSMVQSKGNLDSTVVDVVDNAAETLVAFEMQSQEFRNTQTSFEEYMERLKEDIDQKAEKFGHIEYYDAKLRDGHSNEIAVAADEVRELDDRRKPLALVNPLFAKTSELPPSPHVEEITFEHISLNLPIIAKNALENLKDDPQEEETTSETTDADDQTTTVEEDVVGGEESEEHSEIEDDEAPEEEMQDEDELDVDIYDEEELNQLSDEDLLGICDTLGIEFEEEQMERDDMIQAILDAQNNDNE
ncbi:MAG: hypothetical protein LBV41_09805 [Cytophagaceae bacterium]|jgi:hypothetical protein|nr:hypothetical protein [Cytophagaceae bacterium]